MHQVLPLEPLLPLVFILILESLRLILNLILLSALIAALRIENVAVSRFSLAYVLCKCFSVITRTVIAATRYV